LNAPARGRVWGGGLLALLLGASAFGRDTPDDFLRRIDLDGNGRVDLREFQTYMSAGFDERDSNRNGVLDIAEQPAGARRRPLSRLSHLRALEAAFHRQDRNGDGQLSVVELSSPPG
jgi:hypothetical protein